jgi:hypothetical protein
LAAENYKHKQNSNLLFGTTIAVQAMATKGIKM